MRIPRRLIQGSTALIALMAVSMSASASMRIGITGVGAIIESRSYIPIGVVEGTESCFAQTKDGKFVGVSNKSDDIQFHSTGFDFLECGFRQLQLGLVAESMNLIADFVGAASDNWSRRDFSAFLVFWNSRRACFVNMIVAFISLTNPVDFPLFFISRYSIPMGYSPKDHCQQTGRPMQRQMRAHFV